MSVVVAVVVASAVIAAVVLGLVLTLPCIGSREVITAATEVVSASARGRAPEISPLTGRARAVLRDIEAQRAPCDFASVELLNRLLGVLFGSEPDEREASGAARFPVLWNVDVDDLTDLTKELTKLVVRRGKVEVPYEYLV